MSAPLVIPGELTVFTAHALKGTLLAALPASGPLHLDLSEVTEFDGAGLQLLLATQHEVVARGGTLHLHGVPPKVTAVLALAGVLPHVSVHTEPEQELTS